VWYTRVVSADDLCHNDWTKEIRFSVFHRSKDAPPQHLGSLVKKIDDIKPMPLKEALKDRNDKATKSFITFKRAQRMVETTPGVLLSTKSRLFPGVTDCLARLEIVGKSLDKMDTFGKSDPL
jgi:hypothetical protein